MSETWHSGHGINYHSYMYLTLKKCLFLWDLKYNVKISSEIAQG